MIYLDHAAATPLDPRVFAAMRPFLEKEFGNPSAIYQLGVRAKNAVEAARKEVAQILGAQSDEIIFTGSGTEANNLALFGYAYARKKLGNHIITTAIEHASVFEPCQELAREGFKITYLPVDKFGLVNPEQITKAVTKKTVLVSVMHANNEIGTIEPIALIGKTLGQINKQRLAQKLWPIALHSDAVQAANYLDLNVNHLHTDLLTLNGSKIYGPKGVGVLYKKRGLKIKPLVWGGGQESGWRGGTENAAVIVGLATALGLAQARRDQESKRLTELRDYFWQRLQELPLPSRASKTGRAGAGPWVRVRGIKQNGHPTEHLPNNLHISIPSLDGEALLLYLDEAGVQCSTGAACSLLENESSQVLSSIGLNDNQITGSLRFTLGRSTKKKDIDYVLKVLPKIINKLSNSNLIQN